MIMAVVYRFSRLVSPTTGSFMATCRRSIGMTAVLAKNKTSDPIQKLFVDKLQEYKKKSQASGGELVDFTPEKKARVELERQQIQKRFGEGNLEEFPKFDFVTKWRTTWSMFSITEARLWSKGLDLNLASTDDGFDEFVGLKTLQEKHWIVSLAVCY